MDIPVLIVGAGPTGLTLACDLARRGVEFRIVDKTRKYFAGSRGKGLQPRSLEVLDDLGVIDQILSNGRFHMLFRAYDGAAVLGVFDIHEGRHPTPDVPYASSLIIPQWRVEEILRGRLANYAKRVELATELVDFEQRAEDVLATLCGPDGSEQVRAQYLVGADGGRSFVRGKLGVGFEGETWKDERMLVGDVRLEGLNRNYWHSWPKSAAGWLALCPLPSTDSFQLQAQISPEEPDEPSLGRFQGIVAERTRRPDIRLHDATWLSLYRANVRMVDRYRMNRVFLAGDSAHVHSPAGGQGMNTGIQDAYNLSWKLALVLAGVPDALLDTYEEERLPVAAEMLGITSRLYHRIAKPDGGAPVRGPETLQLGINYRDSSLTVENREMPGSLQAGDRAPDAPCQDSSGKPVRLFDVFRGPHFTLLSFGSGAEFEVPPGHGNLIRSCTVIRRGAELAGEPLNQHWLSDSEDHAHRVYDARERSVFLIRPDGYIGLITDGSSGEAVRRYLDKILGPQ